MPSERSPAWLEPAGCRPFVGSERVLDGPSMPALLRSAGPAGRPSSGPP